MANPNQYFLLADHIKLSLLERQRAISLNLEPTSQDGHISRSLDSLREGLESVTNERIRLEEAAETSASLTMQETEHKLQIQYNDLASQFRGTPTDTTASTMSQPNDPSLSSDFTRASERPRITSSSSFLKKSLRGTDNGAATNSPKSVRFSDAPIIQDEDEARNALFPYRDDPTSGPPDQSHLDNQQIHTYHSQVLADQDEALDRLGESIGRQRELSIQIGDELDEHVQMLDEADGHVDRHTTTLNKARKNLGTVARKAKDNMQLTIILILIIILVLLIIILK
ncbi:Syntaxin [Lachnellula subtilissima]|uniref:Syntaxin n=1 Tax=Lachnellula subtilissima TaxID=602034 RepID=A0A8H8RU65_9HELO|nr:Syntaxin [Lachnellula subtilissima]